MEGGALRRRRMCGLAGARPSSNRPSGDLNERNRRIFRQLRLGSDRSLSFLTVCTHRRRPLLANNEATQRIIAAWQAANSWRVGRYVIMPDHIHLFCAPNAFPPSPLKNWIAFWKNHITRAWPVAALAAGFLGPAITTRRI